MSREFLWGGVLPDAGWRWGIRGFGLVEGVVAEAAGEGFRQQHQVGVAVQRCDQVAVVVAVAGGVVPAGGALYERDAEVLHGGCPGNSCGSGLSRELFVRLSATLPPKARG